MRLCVPFAVCVCACALIWIMADLYGNIDDFLEHKVNVFTILRFYLLQIPSMLVQVLPAALLISTLWTLLALNRRCELVALQSGGMAPLLIFSPFFLFALIWVILLAVDMNWLSAKAEITRERLLLQVKGQNAQRDVFKNLPYVDKANRRIWFFGNLDLNQSTGKNLTIVQEDADWHDMYIYSARTAVWTGDFWRLNGVLKIVYGVDGTVQDQKTFEVLDLPDITTPPKSLSLIVSQPSQLTVSELSQYIATSTSSEDNLAKYRTEWWYRMLYPLSLFIMMLFALTQGVSTDRRNALGGVMVALVVLLGFVASMQLFMAFGDHNRLPPFISVVATLFIFGVIGAYMLAVNTGWNWQLIEMAKRLKTEWLDVGEEEQKPSSS
jgi:lipopolysaccharide export system permease protein